MIKLFKSLNPLNLIPLILAAVVLRMGILLFPPSSLNFSLLEPHAAVLINFPTENLFTATENILIALVITLIQAFLLNTIVNKYNLLGKPSFLSALMYVTVSGLFVPFLVLSPVLICNFLVIWMIDKFLSISRQESAQATMFDVGMIIALGTLFYLPFVCMLLLLWICLFIFRAFIWREWVAGLIGFLTIYFFIAVAYYWTGSLTQLQNFQVPLATDLPKLFKINIYDYLPVIPTLAILLLSAFSLQQKLFRSYVHIRKSYISLFLILVFSIVSFLLLGTHPLSHFLLAVPSAAVFMAFYFISATKPWFYESLYLLLAAVIIYFQFV